MAKITKTEFLDNIQGIINEGMSPYAHVDHTKKFEIGRYVAGLFESGQRNPKLMTYLNNYNNLLNAGNTKEFMVFEQFGQGLAQYASGNKEVKNVINEMNDTLYNYGSELEAYKLIECIQDPAAQQAVKDAYDNYLDDEDEDSRNILIDAIDMCDQEQDPVAPKLLVVITNDSASRLPQIELGTSESKFDEIQRKIKEEKQRKQVEEVKAQVDAYARKIFDEAEAAKQAEKEACTFEAIVNNNGINLRESIKNIASSDAKSNNKLMETLEQYAGALNQGLYEERLYESFLSNISKFNYLLPVEKEIKRINEAVAEKSGSVMVTKILEEMSTTSSYYIIPLIEEDAARYVKNPSDINRSQLRSALCSFANDPYCNAMLEAIERDGLMLTNTLDEKALAVKDQIKMIRENANVSPIYSPVQYIKENECVFNANGQFYVKKGNTLAKLSDEYLNQLSESFVALCQLVNDPHVTINENSITLVGNDKVANIYEGYAEVNGCKETQDTLRNLNEMCMKYDYDTNFFVMASCLLENFNNIANVNFGKHVALNANEGVNVDMFRLGNNIFVNAVNESMLKSTFYHNVNPIQCRNIINKHMGINVANLFEDLLPSQDKLLMKLNETKNEYEASIEKYETTIEKLEKAKEDCSSEDNEKKLDAAIESAKKKVDELKKEYKEWQSQAEAATDADKDSDKSDKGEKKEDKVEKELEDDPNTDVEKSNEPIDADEVDSVKGELSRPIGAEDDEFVEPEEDPTISDDEFDSYLSGDDAPVEGAAEVPADAEPEDEEPEEAGEDTEVSMMHHALAGDGKENEEPVKDELTKEEPEVDADGLPVAEPEIEGDEDEESPEDAEAGFDEVNLGDEEPEVEEPEEAPEAEVEEPAEEAPEAEIEEPEDEEPVIEEPETEEVKMPEGYKIANIAFDQNVKTSELFKTGTITVVCPMVSGDGRMYVKSNDYNFYIDEETHLPVVAASDVPVALYNALVASIQQDDQFTKADSDGVEASEEDKEAPKATDIFFDADKVNAASDELQKNDDEAVFDFSEDPDGESFTISAKEPEAEEAPVVMDAQEGDDDEDQIKLEDLLGDYSDDEETPEVAEPEADEPIIPSYKDGETEVELPAANVDDTDIPEISSEEADEVKDADDADVIDSKEDEEPVAEEPEVEESLCEEDAPANGQQPAANASTGAAPANGQAPAAQPAQPGQQPAQAAQQPAAPANGQQPAANASAGAQPAANASTGAAPANGQQPANESLNTRKSKLTLNEARKAFVKLQAEYNKGGQHFFLSEGTIKPSKKEEAHINENLDGVDLSDEAPMNEPIEDYNEDYDLDTLGILHAKAVNSAEAANSIGEDVNVTDVLENGLVKYFIIANNDLPKYAVFVVNNKIYYKPADQFMDQLRNCELLKAELSDYVTLDDNTEPLDYIDINDQDAAKDLIDTIMLSANLKCMPVEENVKIKRPSLAAEDFEDSKQVDDILHGDAARREFEKNVEDETQKAGVDNPLAPAAQPAQESAMQVMPNAHTLTEAKVENKDMKLVYEPEDWVIIKENGMKAQVINVVNDDKGELTMLTILASNGTAYDVEDLSEIEPDPLYLENIPGRVINSQNLVVPRLGEFDIDPKTRMTRPAQNEVLPKDWHRDLNGKTTPVYIVVEGQRITAEPVSALVEDIANSNKTIRIINEDGKHEEYDKENIEFTEMPYAVVVDSEGKPVRSIQIDPTSYIEAKEDGLVDCKVDGKITKFPKKCIDVLS